MNMVIYFQITEKIIFKFLARWETIVLSTSVPPHEINYLITDSCSVKLRYSALCNTNAPKQPLTFSWLLTSKPELAYVLPCVRYRLRTPDPPPGLGPQIFRPHPARIYKFHKEVTDLWWSRSTKPLPKPDVRGSVHYSVLHKENPTRCNNASNFYFIFI
jgi:hypothetical protein